MAKIGTQPDHGVDIVDGKKATRVLLDFFDNLILRLNNAVFGERLQIPTSYIVAELPSASTPAGWIFVTDEAGGAVPAFSDGTNWRRCTDRAIVST